MGNRNSESRNSRAGVGFIPALNPARKGMLSTDFSCFDSALRSVDGRCGRFACLIGKNMARRSGRHRAGLGPAVARRLGEAGVQGAVFKNRPASGMAVSLPGLLLFSSSRPRLKNCPETSANFACRFRARWRRFRTLSAKGARWSPLRCAGASRRACSFPQSLEAASGNSPPCSISRACGPVLGRFKASYPQIFPVLIARCAAFTGAAGGLPNE